MKRTILIFSLFLAACASAQSDTVVLPEFLVTQPPFIDPSYPTAQAPVQSPNQTAAGVVVRVENVWMDGKDVNANVCFTLPDRSDWSIYEASLNYAGVVLQEYGTTLISVVEPADGQPGLRCDLLTFVVPPDADLSNSTIVINAIGATPREDEYCSVYMPKIQQTLLERGIGIVLECVEVDGMLAMRVVNFPPEMTQEQVEQMVYSDEFYTVKGPWNFPFSLAQ